jgi:NAD(P)-dependent dehydrogenase (short-subunit alcohol dehydrogenase family)
VHETEKRADADPLDGRLVVVTGGTGGLGRGVVNVMRERGARVVVADVRAFGPGEGPFADDPGVVTVAVDLGDEAEVSAFYGSLVERYGAPLWASIHLVGGFTMAPATATSAAEVEQMFRINALTAFLCSREAYRAMHGGGRIVNVAARPALVPTGGMVAYSMAKAAVAALTTALAAEAIKDGVYVNAIAPSIMDTPANRAAMPKADHSRWPSVEDVGRSIAWLASPANALSTGLVMPVYGLA